jgi:hypothetical protein
MAEARRHDLGESCCVVGVHCVAVERQGLPLARQRTHGGERRLTGHRVGEPVDQQPGRLKSRQAVVWLIEDQQRTGAQKAMLRLGSPRERA